MTTKTLNTIDDVGKWMGRASMTVTCFFVVQLYFEFKSTAQMTINNSTRLDVHEAKIQAITNIVDMHGRRLDRIQKLN